MDNIIYELNSILQYMIILFLCHQIGTPRFTFFKTLAIANAPLLILNIVFYILPGINISNIYYTAIWTALAIPLTFSLYKDKLRKKLLVLLIITAVFCLAKFTASKTIFIMFGKYDNIRIIEEHILPFDLMLVSDITLIIFIIISCIRRRKDITFRTNSTYLTVMAVFISIHLAAMIFYYSDNTVVKNENNNLIQFIYQVLLIILIFIQYYNMLHRQQLLRSEENLKHLEAEKKHIYSYYTLADGKFKEITELRYDMQNQVAAVKHLISEERNTDKAQEVIQQIQNRLSASKKVRFCLNPIINAVMTIKMNDISEYGIDTEIILNDCDDLPFDDYDLCSLFANLFDNAFEACLKTNNSDRFIEIKSGIKERYFVLKVCNSCEENPIAYPGKLPDSDKEEPGHGFGTRIIDAITKKYYGSFSMNYADHTMTSIAVLTISGENGNG